jgi:hypothetical protein
MPWYLKWTCQIPTTRFESTPPVSRGGRGSLNADTFGGTPRPFCHVSCYRHFLILLLGACRYQKCKVAGQRRVYYLKLPPCPTFPLNAAFSGSKSIAPPKEDPLEKKMKKNNCGPPSFTDCCFPYCGRSPVRLDPRAFQVRGSK